MCLIDDIPQRLGAALAAAGIATLTDLAARSRADIAAIPGVGPGCLAEIDALLAHHGLALPGEAPPPDACHLHNLSLTDSLWTVLFAKYGPRGVSAAIERHCRAAEGMPPRPDVQARGRFAPGENGRTRAKKT